MLTSYWFLIPLAIWIFVEILKKNHNPANPPTAPTCPPISPLDNRQKASKQAEFKNDIILEMPNEAPKKKKRSRLATMILSKEILERRE